LQNLAVPDFLGRLLILLEELSTPSQHALLHCGITRSAGQGDAVAFSQEDAVFAPEAASQKMTFAQYKNRADVLAEKSGGAIYNVYDTQTQRMHI